MTLTETEYKEFLRTHLSLLYFVGQKQKIISANIDLKKFISLDLQIKFKCRESLFENEDLLDEYIASNFDYLTKEQIQILAGFKKKVRSNFVILKCLINHAIFIDTKGNKFYAVKALGDPFNVFFDTFPVNITTTLIPFKDKIIYDGFIKSSGIFYGRNITETMTENYKNAKREKKIITRLD